MVYTTIYNLWCTLQSTIYSGRVGYRHTMSGKYVKRKWWTLPASGLGRPRTKWSSFSPREFCPSARGNSRRGRGKTFPSPSFPCLILQNGVPPFRHPAIPRWMRDFDEQHPGSVSWCEMLWHTFWSALWNLFTKWTSLSGYHVWMCSMLAKNGK